MTIDVEQEDIILRKLSDSYSITVVFTRYLSEDLQHIKDRPERFDKALVKQFSAEMQEAMISYGLPVGHFNVESIEFTDNKPGGWNHRFEVDTNSDGTFDLVEL